MKERAKRVVSIVKERAKRVVSILKGRAKRVDSLAKERVFLKEMPILPIPVGSFLVHFDQNGFKPVPYQKIFSKVPFDRQLRHLSGYTMFRNVKVTEKLQDDFRISNFEFLGSNPAMCNLF